jgi:hypothetical protein
MCKAVALVLVVARRHFGDVEVAMATNLLIYNKWCDEGDDAQQQRHHFFVA